MKRLKTWCQQCLDQDTRLGQKVNHWIIVANFVFILLLVIEIMYGAQLWVTISELFLGTIFALEIGIRFWTEKRKSNFFKDWFNWIDLLVVLAVFGKFIVFDAVLFQIISGLRLLRSYRVLSDLSHRNRHVFYYYETARILLTLIIFILIMSSVIFQTLGQKSDQIQNFTDAVYFTITTLTTTGYGDITVTDQADKILVIFIMIFGASLFLKLATSLFKPKKVYFECHKCGLTHHEPDAIHCKHCGGLIHIQHPGDN